MSDTTASPAGFPVAWFEIGTDDPAAARAFYGEVFGWTFAPEGPYTVITTGAGHPLQGGIQDTSTELPAGTPRTYAIPCVQVPEVGAVTAAVEAAGGKTVVAPSSTPDGLTYAQVTDPAGNLIGVWTPPPS
jgi:uncharacterized protein